MLLCFIDGTVHIVVGTAGADLDNVDWMPKDWSLKRLYEFGYGVISVANDEPNGSTSLRWDFHL